MSRRMFWPGQPRMQVARNLLQKLWLETRDTDALPPQEASVWSVMPHRVTRAATVGKDR